MRLVQLQCRCCGCSDARCLDKERGKSASKRTGLAARIALRAIFYGAGARRQRKRGQLSPTDCSCYDSSAWNLEFSEAPAHMPWLTACAISVRGHVGHWICQEAEFLHKLGAFEAMLADMRDVREGPPGLLSILLQMLAPSNADGPHARKCSTGPRLSLQTGAISQGFSRNGLLMRRSVGHSHLFRLSENFA